MNTRLLLHLLFLLSTCHGEGQDYSPTSDISSTKGQRKDEVDVRSSCPDPADIAPCECYDFSGILNMYCSDVQDEEELRRVFTATFPVTLFNRFNISHNDGLKELEDGVFGNVTFYEIYIGYSALQIVRDGAFTSSLSTLKSLIIEHCQLTIFPFSKLAPFPHLYLLYLNANEIHSIPPLSSASLRALKLSNNHLSHLSSDVFKGLTAIEQIYLDHCQLKQISPDTFGSLAHLFVIDLSGNELTYLVSQTLYYWGSSSPAYFNFQDNYIDYVELDAFEGYLDSDCSIDLSFNNLTRLEEDVWRPVLKKGTYVNLEDQENLLTCGCDVAWLVRDRELVELVADAGCANGLTLGELNAADFVMCG